LKISSDLSVTTEQCRIELAELILDDKILVGAESKLKCRPGLEINQVLGS
jgi:hypothetical protein